jgi:hypothetical protein
MSDETASDPVLPVRLEEGIFLNQRAPDPQSRAWSAQYQHCAVNELTGSSRMPRFIMWTYAQKSGDFLQDGQHVATGYSGIDDGKNNPLMQAVHNVGPIPQGDWTIVGPPVNTPDHGPFVLRLSPAADTNTFGRSGFLMHGDSIESPGSASHGCVIMPRAVREQVWNSGDAELEVIPDLATQDLQEGVDT